MTLNEFMAQSRRGTGMALANALQVSQPTVSDWCTGKKRVPIERCAAIERATNGAVTRKDLRPDDWHEIWPELVGGFATLLQSGLDNADAALQADPGNRMATLVKQNRTQALTELATPQPTTTEPAGENAALRRVLTGQSR